MNTRSNIHHRDTEAQRAKRRSPCLRASVVKETVPRIPYRPSPRLPIRRSGGAVASLERRKRQRFPISLGIRFTSGNRRMHTEGQGEVLNISSSGVAFRTATELTPGTPIQASMCWPVTLNGDCILRVSMEGKVVRTADNGLAVMSLERYEFRTGGRLSAPRADIEAAKRNFTNLSGGNGNRLFV